jgi:hypothetical protein
VKLGLEYTTWNSNLLRFGVEVSPRASLADIIEEARKHADEQFEEVRYYVISQNGKIASAPWTESIYQVKPFGIIATSVTVHTRNGTFTVQVLTYPPELWPGLVLADIPDPPLTLHQTRLGVFTAYYEDQMKETKARFVRRDEGEEHVVKVLPYWEHQVIRVREASGRDMIPDDSQPPNSRGSWNTHWATILQNIR